MDMTLLDIAKACGGTLRNAVDDTQRVIGVTWDSREVEAGCMYVALPGERADGHDFVDAAVAAGAVAVMVTHGVENPVPQVIVGDAQKALGDVARAWRDSLDVRVVGLTGSTGKTTTKALMRDVLGAAGSVVATQGNQNNEIGVPRTLLAATNETDFIVCEMGMRGLGQITELCEIAHPNWGLVTNVGESHMELLKTQESIAQAKGELFCALPSGGVAFANGRDQWVPSMRQWARLEDRGVTTLFFVGPDLKAGEGRSDDDVATALAADHPTVWAEGARLNERGYADFTLRAAGFDVLGNAQAQGSCPCSLRLKGLHNVTNACAAAAVGLAAGLSLAQVREALGASVPEQGRQQLRQATSGALIDHDAYNANPDSMAAALATFAAFAVAGQRIAVLGDMGELGPIAEDAHFRVGQSAARGRLDRLYCVGALSTHIARGARLAGMAEDTIVVSDTLDDVIDELRRTLGPDDAVLVKASHFMEFDRLVKELVEE